MASKKLKKMRCRGTKCLALYPTRFCPVQLDKQGIKGVKHGS